MMFSACIELLFSELPFLERIERAKYHNFDAIEFWDFKGKDIKAIKDRCMTSNIKVATFVGNTNGQMIDPNDNTIFIDGVKESVKISKELECSNLILTTNILGQDRSVAPLKVEIESAKKRENIIKVLSSLDGIAKDNNITLNIEPLNTKVDHMGYFLNNSSEAFDILKIISSKNIKLLYDIYHMQIMEGNLIENIRSNIDFIGHIHIADVPGRHEPGTGEINFAAIFKALNEVDYKGYVGFEYMPLTDTDSSLKAVKDIFKF
ncbi:MAG: hydroxypyruvate isomerase family protein [Candidatus Humimicrobiaceae bacterium]